MLKMRTRSENLPRTRSGSLAETDDSCFHQRRPSDDSSDTDRIAVTGQVWTGPRQ